MRQGRSRAVTRFRLLTAVAAYAAATSAHAQQVGDAEQGLRLAREACAECHMVVKSADKSPKADVAHFRGHRQHAGNDRIALAVALHTPHQTMPNVVIKGEDAQNIIAYVLSLRKSD